MGWLGVIIALVCAVICPVTARAEAVVDDDSEASILTLDLDDTKLDNIETVTSGRRMGVKNGESITLFGQTVLNTTEWGAVLSPFQLTSKQSSVSVKIDEPTLTGYPLEVANKFGGGEYKLAVQGQSGNAVYYVEPDSSDDDQMTFTVPMIEDTVVCALIQRDPQQLAEASPRESGSTVTEPILENAYGSSIAYTYTYQMETGVAEALSTSGNNIYSNFDFEYHIFTGDAQLDTDSLALDSTEWDIQKIDDLGNGNYVVVLGSPSGMNDAVPKNAFTDSITLKFNTILASDKFDSNGKLTAVVDIVFRRVENGVVNNCLNDTTGAITAEMDPAVTIKPADMTIYEGGEAGYSNVVDATGSGTSDGSLPEPLFYIVPSEETPGVLPTSLVFTKGAGESSTKSWKVEKAGADANGTPLYKFVANDGTQDVRVTFTDAEGNAHLSDSFDPSEVGDLSTSYSIDIYPGDDRDTVQAQPSDASGDNSQYPISFSSGTLTVRAVAGEENVTSAPVDRVITPVPAGEGRVVVDSDTTYSLNDTNVPDKGGVALLFDDIIDDATGNRTEALQNRVNEQLGAAKPGYTRNYQAQYLDLVDTQNGNAWVKASRPVTVYWGYPSGTDKSTDFKLYHFSGLHRDGENSGFNVADLATAEVVPVTINPGDNGISFTVNPGGFSPYVLTWDVDARHTITATAGTGGSISPSGEMKVADGGSQTFTITANSGYEIADVLVDNVSVGAVSTYTFDNVSANHTISVTFRSTGGGGGTVTPTRYTITATAGQGGSISPSGTVTVSAGADYTFTITPDEGNKISNVVIDGTSVGALESYTFEDVRANHTISVTFGPGNMPADPGDTGVSDWLDTADHGEYLHGYGDGSGTFGPDNNMTRGEVATMFYNLLLDKSLGDRPYTFKDVSEDAFYAEPVRVLASRGILLGTSPETFEPDRSITRAEFTAIAMRFTNGDYSGENIFTDVSEDAWYYDVVVGSIKYGWIYGYQDGTGRFGPDNTITRAEATCIANRMLGRVPDGVWINAHMDDLKLFPDVTQEHFAWRDIIEATNAHDYVKDGGFETWTGLR